MTQKDKTFKVEVTRRYYVTETFTVEAATEGAAHIVAENLSDNKDYTGRLQLEDVEILTHDGDREDTPEPERWHPDANEHPYFDADTWREDVKESVTSRGYHDYVVAGLEEASFDCDHGYNDWRLNMGDD